MQELSGVDTSSWQVTLLPYPKRFSRGKALGFCGGQPVGVAENARAKTAACWWPDGQPELLTLEGHKDLNVLFARGDAIPGSWIKSSGRIGAAMWGLHGGALVGTDLDDARYERTWAEGAGGGVVVGVGAPKSSGGSHVHDVGLVWHADGRVEVIAVAGKDVCLRATDGQRFAGSVGARATLWAGASAAPVDLGPAGMPASEVDALDGDTQVGIAFKGLAAHAVLWRGSATSVVDLTPRGYQESRAFDGAQGYQVGLVRKRSTTRNGGSACDDAAVIWQGAADRWFDLNALLPEPYNASNAWAIHVGSDHVWVCGEALRVEVSDPGTPRETHYVPKSQAVVWRARLSG